MPKDDNGKVKVPRTEWVCGRWQGLSLLVALGLWDGRGVAGQSNDHFCLHQKRNLEICNLFGCTHVPLRECSSAPLQCILQFVCVSPNRACLGRGPSYEEIRCWLMSGAFAGLCVVAFAAVPLQILHMACSKPREPHKFLSREHIKIMVFELSAPPGPIKTMVFELGAASGSIKTMVFHAPNSFLL